MMKRKTFLMSAIALMLTFCLSVTSFAAGTGSAFTDVQESDYFYPAVQWGAEAGITNGVGNDRFDPAGTVTRAQAVTFLWRMAGEPAATKTETFSDVGAGSWYEKAVQWAVEEGITVGTGNNKFSPYVTLDRAMCLTMLYRLMDAPLDEIAALDPVEFSEDLSFEEMIIYMVQQMIALYSTPELFPDVEKGSYYEMAVIWGSMNEILTDDNTGKMEEGVKFRPTDPCPRSEMISFLYQTQLMIEQEDAPNLYELGAITLAIPKDFDDQLYRMINALPDEDTGTLVVISEIASREAAETQGLDPDDGIGELFRIDRVTEEEMQQILRDEIGYYVVFAKDDNGLYYVFSTPTDVRYLRESVEQMTADQETWSQLVEWADKNVIEDILEYSEGLTPVN